ncbi:protease pro-enzyme activation domain-containing protein [Pelomonas sp. KK5]|uniref:S53 family peptidase n=1 Tax=Pelomonas sp. KK5 TaxID=1855730 RepID=UPI00097BAF63|nr:S53 family serine peptidase [Pelomonas sp. KK5]
MTLKPSRRAIAAATLFLASFATASPIGGPGAAPLDAGPTAPATPITVSIVLKVQNPDALDRFVASSSTPGSPGFRNFLSVQQFRERFAPSDDQIRQITNDLKRAGITVDQVYDNHLLISATGTADQFSQAFATTLRDYVDAKGRRFHRPDHAPQLSDLILYVAGLNSQQSTFKPHLSSARASPVAPHKLVLPQGNSTATGVSGDFTTGDVANIYNVNPLYARGLDGRGTTIGIVTLAGFLPQDCYDYWSAIGLKVKPNRITQVHVDGGAEIAPNVGVVETSLDVQQSGGLAPGAKIVVYDAPNTEAGFVDVFYKAVSDNRVDTLSVSWGSAEIFNYAIPGVSFESVALMAVYHQAFAEAAAQGISAFAASGDYGAYETIDTLPYPKFTKVLSVLSPASDPYIIAAGGTTLGGDIALYYDTVHVPGERVWGWDYLSDYVLTWYGPGSVDSFLFPSGGGGGVSVFWPVPFYQRALPGIRASEPNQQLVKYPNYPDLSVQQYLFTVPAGVRGRNLPDVSLNADPYTGYLILSTIDGGWSDYNGGTSFVAPQMNGIFSLFVQARGSRLGLLHPQLYGLKLLQQLSGRDLGLRDITTGDNWFYVGAPGYDPGTGLGVLNVNALERALP